MRDLFLLDPDVHFLNHGSFGAAPRPVFAEYQRWQRELERQPVEFLGRRSDGLLDAARAAVAAHLGTERDNLVFVLNATHGVNIVARSLDLRPGDEVLTTDLEYGACDETWAYLAGKAGAKVVRMPVDLPVDDPATVVEAVWAGVTPRTRVLYLSHITSGTALTLPVEELCRRARSAGILSVIDGAHAPGHVPVDLDALGADVYTGNLHKWLSAPKGSGMLYVRPEHQSWMESTIVSWGWVAGSGHDRTDSQFVSRNQWQGTRDLAAFLATPAAIDFQRAHDWPAVQERCHALVTEARRRVCALTGLEPASPEPAADAFPWYRQMVLAPLPPVDAVALKARLYDEHRVEVPLTKWRDRDFVRVSVQAYNTEEDIDALLDGLETLLPQVRTGA